MSLKGFKNPTAKSLIAELQAAKLKFEERKKGRDWVALVMTVANTFPEDKHRIVAMFQKKQAKRSPQKLSRDATPKIKVAPVIGNGCKDCPDAVNNAISGGPVQVQDNAKILDTTDKVLAAFESDALALANYAKSLGVNIGRSKKAPVIARKIAFFNREKVGKNEEE